MSVQLTRVGDGVGGALGAPDAVDLADVWLADALACVLEAWGLPEEDPCRSDTCRRAVVFAALGLEGWLNRAMRGLDADEWRAVARLAPAERFRLAPRLLQELERAAEDVDLGDLVAAVFDARDEIVGAGPAATKPSAPFSPVRARSIVEAGATVCAFLATLTGEEEARTARRVRDAVAPLAQREPAVARPTRDWDPAWNEFPPDVIGS